MSAMQHADDDFLSDVAALVHADGTRFDAGLQRDRLLVHVSMEERDSSFDSQRLRCLSVGFADSLRGQQLSNARCTLALDVEVETRFTSIRDTCDDGCSSRYGSAYGAVFRQRRKPVG